MNKGNSQKWESSVTDTSVSWEYRAASVVTESEAEEVALMEESRIGNIKE